MNVEYINPFIEAVFNTMKTMLGVKPERLTPVIKDNPLTQGDVSGIIGFASKNVSGAVALSFPTDTALKVYQLMMGEPVSQINSDVQDVVGELANIVAGGAKKLFSDAGFSFHISIPTIVVGRNHIITHKLDVPVVIVPFKLGSSPFSMEITMKIDEKKPFLK